jgi:hypothetical protein
MCHYTLLFSHYIDAILHMQKREELLLPLLLLALTYYYILLCHATLFIYVIIIITHTHTHTHNNNNTSHTHTYTHKYIMHRITQCMVWLLIRPIHRLLRVVARRTTEQGRSAHNADRHNPFYLHLIVQSRISARRQNALSNHTSYPKENKKKLKEIYL